MNKPGKFQPYMLQVVVLKRPQQKHVIRMDYCGKTTWYDTPDLFLEGLRSLFEDQDGVDMMFFEIYNQCGFSHIDPNLEERNTNDPIPGS